MDQRFQESQIMICLICRRAAVLAEFTSVKFERGEMHLVINNVPARVCPGCGEAYVEEEVAVRLLQLAKDSSRTGVVDAHDGYHNA